MEHGLQHSVFSMRWIVLVLLFANAGYFAWGYYHQSHKSYRAVKVDSEVLVQAGKRLVLLSEVTSQMPGRMLESQALEENTQAQCLVVGPFEFSAEADRLQQKLFHWGFRAGSVLIMRSCLQTTGSIFLPEVIVRRQ